MGRNFYIFGILVLAICCAATLGAQETPDPDTLKNEGNLLYRAGEIDSAIVKWQEAITIDSTYSFAYNNIGIALYDKKDYSGSIENLTKAVEIDSAYAKAWNSLGNAYLAIGEYENAVEVCLKAVELEPRDEVKLANLANGYLALGDFVNARTYYEQAIDRNGKYTIALNNLGVICQKQGDVEKAIEYFRKAVKSDSEFLSASLNLGVAYYEEGGKSLQRAHDTFVKLLETDKDNPLYLYHIGLVFLKSDDVTNAKKNLERAGKLLPEDVDIIYALGLAYAQGEAYSDAVEQFSKVMDIEPDHDGARRALQIAISNM